MEHIKEYIDNNKERFISELIELLKIPSISAASIIAKVTRDKAITNLGKKFKDYHWDKNYGYGTRKHLIAIKNLGITSHHRKTFSPINKTK